MTVTHLDCGVMGIAIKELVCWQLVALLDTADGKLPPANTGGHCMGGGLDVGFRLAMCKGLKIVPVVGAVLFSGVCICGLDCICDDGCGLVLAAIPTGTTPTGGIGLR